MEFHMEKQKNSKKKPGTIVPGCIGFTILLFVNNNYCFYA